eukprot:8782974-Alexandrium_andersonii.AAC.1
MCEVVAKAASAAIVAAAGDAPRCKLMPQQVGAGTPLGALQMAEEAIDEAHHSPHRVVATIDIANAYGETSRLHALNAVRRIEPRMVPYFKAMWAVPSVV